MQAARRARWHQTATDRIADPEDAARLIAAAGVVTLYPASPEIPNLFHAYTGDPASKTDSGHSSPSGEVYGWRWALGRREAVFYSVLARGRPTWVGWPMLPAVLRLCGETRSPDDLYAAGEISADAQRIARVLGAANDALSTGELRRQAGFPTGKPQRAAYLKAVDELDTRLLLAKVFSADEATRTRWPLRQGWRARPRWIPSWPPICRWPSTPCPRCWRRICGCPRRSCAPDSTAWLARAGPRRWRYRARRAAATCGLIAGPDRTLRTVGVVVRFAHADRYHCV